MIYVCSLDLTTVNCFQVEKTDSRNIPLKYMIFLQLYIKIKARLDGWIDMIGKKAKKS